MKTDAKIQELVDSYGSWFNEENGFKTGKMTNKLAPYTNIFSPIRINRMTVKNRLIMAPMGNICMAEETGRPNEKMIAYFTERAKGGVGLITTGLIPVSYGIDHSLIELDKLTYFPRIDRSRTVYMGWRDLAQSVHSYGSRIFVQLTPGLGRVGNPQCLTNQLKFPCSASLNPNWYMSEVPCMPLTDHACKMIIKKIGQAAADAKAFGLDGVYLHGHEGYLLEQMTNPAFNRRKIGRYANWQNFGLDMITEIRRRTGSAYPIMYRIDLSLALNETYGDTMDIRDLRKFKNGRTIDMTLDYMKNLIGKGVDIFDVDMGCYDNWFLPHPPEGMPPACFADISQIAKDYFEKNNILSNAGVKVPVVAVGKLGYPDIAEEVLLRGKADMIMLGRPLLADPQWPNKVREGRVDEIIPCIGCQEGCINEFVEGGHPQCAVNPRTAFEEKYPEDLLPAEKKKKIAVIGAGPAGIMAAVTAARRGHDVTIYEKAGMIGGRLNAGKVAKIKFDIQNYLEYLEGLVERTSKQYKLKVVLNAEATVEMLKKAKYEAVIYAAGTKDVELRLPGYEKANSCQAVEILLDPKKAANARKVIVIGGGVVGCEVAFFLNKELGKDVTVIEMEPYFMNHICTANRGYLIHYMHRSGVRLLNCTRLLSYEIGGIKVSRNLSKTVPDPYNTWSPILPPNVENPLAKKIKEETEEQFIEGDLIIQAAGGRPDEEGFYKLQKELNTCEMYNIGDSFRGGKIFEATKAGYAVGLTV
ncbi:MAG: FAD-dependent oxidoreductase [Clostridia bacterium]